MTMINMDYDKQLLKDKCMLEHFFTVMKYIIDNGDIREGYLDDKLNDLKFRINEIHNSEDLGEEKDLLIKLKILTNKYEELFQIVNSPKVIEIINGINERIKFPVN